MSNQIAAHAESRGDHWDATYRRGAPTELSWHQPEPTVPLELIEALAVARDGAVIDVGGGASSLVDRLLARGFLDVSVLDVSAAALALTRERLGRAQGAQLVQADILSWQPAHCYHLWHDRAVFHFLVNVADRQRYIEVLTAAVCPGCHVIIGTFAPDGPERCSGLPVARYSADDIASLLVGSFEIVAVRREDHVTPAGTTQPFTWVAARALH